MHTPNAGSAALLLCAGRGERMRPLTDTCPKPLLKVRGVSLLAYHLNQLALGGIHSAVINTAWLGEQIESQFGPQWQHLPSPAGTPAPCTVQLHYSHEGREFGHALETAGGAARALPLLANAFWCVAADAFAPGFELGAQRLAEFDASPHLAHLYLVPNPAHNTVGDFGLHQHVRPHLAIDLDKAAAATDGLPRWTYSGIGLFKAALFQAPHVDIAHGNPQGIAAPLREPLRKAMRQGLVSAEIYTGAWADIGTPDRLAQMNQRLK